VAESVISVRGLRKSYGDLEAVGGIDLAVKRGEVFAFLGPNGAGKTTTVEILEGYRQPTAGELEVLSENPVTAGRDWRERIGIVLQQCKMEPVLTVRETLDRYAGYYRRPRPVSETIDVAGLGEKADDRVGRLSGGQQRRLDVAVALIGDPELLFLDEPTTGFDPSARRHAWRMIADLRSLGKTIFLTTHYMDEAQWLADRVAIIAGGTIVADGAPDELVGRDGAAAQIAFRLPHGIAAADLPLEVASSIADGREPRLDGEIRLRTDRPVALLNALTGWALERDLELAGLEVRRPSLEDVYLRLTGEQAE
jgi:ABC-2 type transport system ATP-binding protein